MAKTRRRRPAGQVYDPSELLRKTKLLTDEVAFLLDVAPRTVERYMEQGKIQYVRTPGGHRRALTESVRKWI